MFNYYPQAMAPMPQMGMNQQYQTPKKTEIIHVNGENGAMALQMMPNCQALLLDDTAPIVWLAQTDGAGYKTLTPYSITPLQKEPPVDVNALEERIARIEEVINNDESNASAARTSKSTKSNKSD